VKGIICFAGVKTLKWHNKASLNIMKFTINSIPETIVKAMQAKNVWRPECPVAINELRLLEVSYYDFTEQVSQGQIIVLDQIAQNVLSIFKELLVLKFPIYSMRLMNDFDGDDEYSMAANNSSGFNFRQIAETDTLSMHSYGLAIDINPLQNPYIVIDEGTNNVEIFPKQGAEFINRDNLRKGMVEPIVPIFKKHGISIWGGDWSSPIDYHHFQTKRSASNHLITNHELV